MFLQASVILSTGGGSASVHAGIPPPPPHRDQTPLSRPPKQTPPSRPPRADTPKQTPPEQTTPGADTLQSRHPPGPESPPGTRPPWSRHPPGADPLGSRLWDTVNERPVRVLLECILVFLLFLFLFYLV